MAFALNQHFPLTTKQIILNLNNSLEVDYSTQSLGAHAHAAQMQAFSASQQLK